MNCNQYLANLRHRHRQSMSATPGPGRMDRDLNLSLAAVCGLATLILVATTGYRVGFEAIHGFSRDLSARFLEELTNCGDYLLAICLMALLAKRQPRALWMGVLATACAGVLCTALKIVFNTARPPAVLGGWLTVLGPVWKAHSFPSGHTVTAFIVAACFAVGAPKGARLLFFSVAAAVGVSRVWVGVHWPMDVTAGAAVAGVAVVLAMRTMKFSSWGLGLAPHLLVVVLIALCSAVELVRVP